MTAEQERAAVVAELPDAGHVAHGPLYWPHSKPWEPDTSRCRAAVSGGARSFNFHQCSRKVKITRLVNHKGTAIEMGYCTTHDPVRIKEKNKAWRTALEARWDAEKVAAAEKRNRLECGVAAIEALRQIADGHNDPRSLAIEILDKHNLRGGE